MAHQVAMLSHIIIVALDWVRVRRPKCQAHKLVSSWSRSNLRSGIIVSK